MSYSTHVSHVFRHDSEVLEFPVVSATISGDRSEFKVPDLVAV